MELGGCTDWYPPGVDKQSYTFSASRDSLPKNALLMPTVGNGHLATVIFRDRVFMNGFYNGEGKESHRAAIPALNRIKVKPLPEGISIYSLDCIQGTFKHTQTRADVTVEHTVYAHRTIPSLLVNQITLRRAKGAAAALTVELEKGTEFKSPDIKLVEVPATELPGASGPPSGREMSCYTGSILVKEVPEDVTVQMKHVYICMDNIPDHLTLPADVQEMTETFLMSVNSMLHQALHQYTKGHELFEYRILLWLHIQGWASLWQAGRIDVWGDDLDTNRVVYGSQYYILSSLPSKYESDCSVAEFYGLSPESLAYGDKSHVDYLGHVFWDQETWMYPPVLLLHPDIARQLIGTRLRVVKQAHLNAEKNGMKGTQFPWEQGVTGVSFNDVCQKYELHINADIALALRQYFYATGKTSDKDLTTLTTSLAEYWVSRLSWLEDKQKFGILNVMPPDDAHYPVNNSAYTNLAAQLAISLVDHIHSVTPGYDGPTTRDLLTARFPTAKAVDIYVPFDTDLNYHPEFDGYNVKDPKTSHVRQADVILIGYPLDLETNQTVRKNDLELYEQVTTNEVPAMTWSMFCVGYLELNETEKATTMFRRQLLQVLQPFQVWSKYPDGEGAINSITGMGGFLQSLLNGYVGIRLKASSMTIKPSLPPSTSRLKITGLSYHGAKFDVDITESKVEMQLTKCSTSETFSIQQELISEGMSFCAEITDINKELIVIAPQQ